jgi:hypothetical protein
MIYTDDSSDTPYEPSEGDVDDNNSLPSDLETTEADSVEEELGYVFGMYQKTRCDHKEAIYNAYTLGN